eukprot:m.53820 g.53820  ORF g.53820 m.53820 type:complete len:67 (+) comp16704_c0_seq2:251-451(+)
MSTTSVTLLLQTSVACGAGTVVRDHDDRRNTPTAGATHTVVHVLAHTRERSLDSMKAKDSRESGGL